jgi:transposase
MSRKNTPNLSKKARQELESLHKTSDNHGLRKRCQTILLKADGRDSKDVGQIVGMSAVSVNSWLKRYKIEGISGLFIRAGRGRKALIDQSIDECTIKNLVKNHRQRVETAKVEWELSSGKKVSLMTFKRFLKSLAENISE